MRTAAPARTGRPILLLTVWAALLLVFAAIAPLVQSALAVPYELFALVMLAPAAASVIVLLRPSWTPAPWAPAPARDVLVATGTALSAVLVYAIVLGLLLGRAPSWPPVDLGAPLAVAIALQLVGVLGEEVGWRGVVQRTGEAIARPWVVSAIAGSLFGATHLGYWSLGPLPVLTFALAAACMSLAITSVFRGSLVQRMVPAVVVHLGVNMLIAAYTDGEEALAVSPAALLAMAALLAASLLLRRIR